MKGQQPSPDGLASCSLNLGFVPQALLVGAQALLFDLLSNLGLEFVKRGQLGVADVVYADDVKAELGLDGCVGHLALVEFQHGLGELGNVAARVGPVKVATVGT